MEINTFSLTNTQIFFIKIIKSSREGPRDFLTFVFPIMRRAD